MDEKHNPRWLDWARELQAMGQTGLFYSPDRYHTERYHRLIEIAAEIMHNHTGTGFRTLVEDFLNQPGYATPKIDVRGAVFREGRILLVRERRDGRWCMPGGWADVGEFPAAMVAREVLEESGFTIHPVKVIGVYDANRGGEPLSAYHAYKIIFLCDLVSGSARPSSETSEVGFFQIDDLPPLSEVRTNLQQISEAYAHLEDPGRRAAFD